MKIKDRLIGAFFGDIIEQKVSDRLKAASMTDYRKEDEGWRKISGIATRELLSTTQDRMIEIAFWLWETNPMAKWLIEITKDFILAEGLPYEAKDLEVKQVLDDFWLDPINRMDIYLEKHVRELFLFGELCFPVFIAQQTGRVRIGYIDPAQIDKVETDPQNVKMNIGIILKGAGGKPGRRLKTILPKDAEFVLSADAQGLRDNYTDGECFFYAINNVTNSPRGRSELLVVADWLDSYEQFLFDYADKWPLLNTFVWDLLVSGGDANLIDEQIKKFTKKSGSVYGHNEKVTLTPSNPDLKAIDAETGARIFRNHILGPFSYPEHWYGGGGDVNRATAVEMGAPAFKALSSKQRYVKFILEDILGYAITKAREARYLNVSDEDANNYSIITPEIATKDLTKYSTVIQQTSTSLATAELQGWIDKDTARKIFIFALTYLGIEINIEELQANIEAQVEQKGYEDYVSPGKGGNGGKGNAIKTSP